MTIPPLREAALLFADAPASDHLVSEISTYQPGRYQAGRTQSIARALREQE